MEELARSDESLEAKVRDFDRVFPLQTFSLESQIEEATSQDQRTLLKASLV